MPCEHDGHRKRLKARFVKSGLDDFEPHNVLELLLFYSIPRKDTNPIAHKLISRFGSLSGVFDAKPEELMKVDGITENTAVLISMVPQLARKYLKDEFGFEYSHSLFSMKPILKLSEIDDSRPTLVKQFSTNPTFVSVLSGKINTVYDLKEVLDNDNK